VGVSELDGLPHAPPDIAAHLPEAQFRFAPASVEEVAAVLDAASERRSGVLLWGAGTHQGIGYPVEAGVVLSTARLDRVVDWQPEDLTVVVEAGVTVGRLEEMLAERGQTALLPEWAGEATVGGVVAAAISGYRRARLGPTRDRVLEVTLVTGDGRVVRGGGRVVKNVSGYDLPRLATGSLGALGAITSVCLKLWPLPGSRATLSVPRADVAWREASRPLAVLQTPAEHLVYLQGTPEEVTTQAERLGGTRLDGHRWPSPPSGEAVVSIQVRPSLVVPALRQLPDGAPYVAQHGVGEVTVGIDADPSELERIREWSEARGGSLVVRAAPRDLYEQFDPWGRPPDGLGIQRRLVAAFDPVGISNPGRLPGRI
jgi:glycolate oxidase FAD binding subunit